MTSVLWFRRDLRLGDNPALLAARDAGGDGVLPLFVLDDALRRPSGAPRLAFLYRAACARRGGRRRLVVLRGRPESVVPRVVEEVEAPSVHVAADSGPYGRERDGRVEGALPTGCPWSGPARRTRSRRDGCARTTARRSGSTRRSTGPGCAHGWRAPAGRPRHGALADRGRLDGVPADPDLPAACGCPTAGEAAALDRVERFRDGGCGLRRPSRPAGPPGTSRLSAHLKYGTVHPRTLLADLAGGAGQGAETFRKELAWREFYADVLWHEPALGPGVPQHEVRGAGAGLGPATGSPPGPRGGPGTRSSTPGCGSCGRGLGAQPGPHDRRVVPGQGPAPGLDAGRAGVPAPAGGRGPGLEQPRLAVGGRLRHGRLAVLPRVQPDHAGTEVRPGRRLRAAVRGRAAVGGRAGRAQAVGAARRPPGGYPERIVDHAAARAEALARYEKVRR